MLYCTQPPVQISVESQKNRHHISSYLPYGLRCFQPGLLAILPDGQKSSSRIANVDIDSPPTSLSCPHPLKDWPHPTPWSSLKKKIDLELLRTSNYKKLGLGKAPSCGASYGTNLSLSLPPSPCYKKAEFSYLFNSCIWVSSDLFY